MILQNILAEVAENAIRLEGFPHITNKSKWQTTPYSYWTGGFWIGLLWLCYKISHDRKHLGWAYDWLKRLEERQTDKTSDLV